MNPKPHDMNQSIESAAFMWFTKRIIGDKADPYLIRWVILQTPLFSIYIHKMVRSDYERALHDHPWPFLSLILRPYAEWWHCEKLPYRHVWGRDKREVWNKDGSAREIYTVHQRWDILYRPANWRHRVVIKDLKAPGWTLVLTGPRTRRWGFWPVVQGVASWCHWKRYNMELAICESEPIAGRKGLD